MEYKGQLKGFPKAIVDKMLIYQAEWAKSCNIPNKGIEGFEKYVDGGFRWSSTIEGGSFWKDVIQNRNFNRYFELYPQTQQLKLF